MKIVFDTNILVSEILAEGLCREIVEIHVSDHHPILSLRVWDEFVEALEEKFGLNSDNLPLLRLHHRLASRVEPPALDLPVCRDTNDDWVPVNAVAG